MVCQHIQIHKDNKDNNKGNSEKNIQYMFFVLWENKLEYPEEPMMHVENMQTLNLAGVIRSAAYEQSRLGNYLASQASRGLQRVHKLL